MGQCLTYFFPSGEIQNSNNWANRRPPKPESVEKNQGFSCFRIRNLPRIEERQLLASVAKQPLQIIDIEDLNDNEDLQAMQTNVEVPRKPNLEEGGRVLTACRKPPREQELQNQTQNEDDTATDAKKNMTEKMSIKSLASSFTSTSASDSDYTDDEDGATAPFPRPSPWRKLYLKAIKPKEIAATTKKELQLSQERASSRFDWHLLKRRFNRRPGLWRLRKNRRIVPTSQEVDSGVQGRGNTNKTIFDKVRDSRVEDDRAGVVGGILLLQGIDETSRAYHADMKTIGQDEDYFASCEED